MNGSKKARNTPSIANKTSVFGIMGGLAPRTGTSNVSVYRHLQMKGSRGLPQLYGKPIDYQKTYLKTNKLLSVNPLGSGGVGKKTSMFHQSCNCSQNIPMSSLLGSSFRKIPWIKGSASQLDDSAPPCQSCDDVYYTYYDEKEISAPTAFYTAEDSTQLPAPPSWLPPTGWAGCYTGLIIAPEGGEANYYMSPVC
jgi:hypothetical protein